MHMTFVLVKGSTSIYEIQQIPKKSKDPKEHDKLLKKGIICMAVIKLPPTMYSDHLNLNAFIHPSDNLLMLISFLLKQDLDVVKFIISALSTYFPGVLYRILLFEMPWLLSCKSFSMSFWSLCNLYLYCCFIAKAT